MEAKVKEDWELEIERKVAENRAKEARREAIRQDKIEAENKRNVDALAASRRFLEESKATVEKGNATMAGISKSQRTIDETTKKWEEFRERWDEIIANSLGCVHIPPPPEPIDELQEIYGLPQLYTDNEIAEKISQRKQIWVLVGAGVSAESGVPTYKGNTNTVLIGGKQMSHQDAAMRSVFEEFPLDYWNKQHKFKQLTKQCEPNVVHHAIARLVNHFCTRKTSGFVITMNIDGFDRAVTQGGEIFEIHGNLDYMRCSNQCTQDLLPSNLGSPDELTTVPTCPNCGALCVPHMLNFDEAYTEEYYRAKSAQQMFENIDVLIILGTQLATNLPNRLVDEATRKKVLILEGNIEPVLNYGKVMVNKQPLGQSFPAIVEKIIANDNARGQVLRKR